MKKKSYFAGTKWATLLLAGLVLCLGAFSKTLDAFAYPVNPGKVLPDFAHERAGAGHSANLAPALPLSLPVDLPYSEVESKDESDDEASKMCTSLCPTGDETRHAEKYTFSQLRADILNRPSVSLFVLYHCWRSFPG